MAGDFWDAFNKAIDTLEANLTGSFAVSSEFDEEWWVLTVHPEDPKLQPGTCYETYKGRSEVNTVFKYEIPIDDEVSVMMPRWAQVLSVGNQGEKLCVWARVDTDDELTPRKFRVAGTGHPLDDERTLDFLGTVQFYGGALVFHVFEIFNASEDY